MYRIAYACDGQEYIGIYAFDSRAEAEEHAAFLRQRRLADARAWAGVDEGDALDPEMEGR